MSAIPVVLLAGGKGTRLNSLESKIPKLLFPINNKPVIEYQFDVFRKSKVIQIYLLTGFLSEEIEKYITNNCFFNEMYVEVIKEKKPLGTAGSLKQLERKINSSFIVINGDLIINFDPLPLFNFHNKNNAIATLFTHPNDHPFDSDLVDYDSDTGQIIKYYKKPHDDRKFYKNSVCAGVYVFSNKVFDNIKLNREQDIGKDLIPYLLKENERIFAYNSYEYIKDMGTPQRALEVKRDILSGKFEQLSNKKKQKAIFIDRDGVLIRDVGFLDNLDNLELLSSVSEAVKKINNAGFLTIVVTNQSVLARNLLNEAELNLIHNKLEWEIGRQGAYIDKIYYCPHHPDSGYHEERKEYKIKCNCRKPAPGLLLRAAEEFNIDLGESYIVGDSEADLLAGKNANLKANYLVKSNGVKWKSTTLKPDYKVDKLNQAVEMILSM